MKKNSIYLCLLFLPTCIYSIENIQRLLQDAERILHELEQHENLYIPRVLNKELYNLLGNLSNTELITFMREAEKLQNKQLTNSTAAVIVDRYDLSNAPKETELFIKEQLLASTHPYIDKYSNIKKHNKNGRACSNDQMSIQDYVNTYGLPIISLGTASILNFDNKNINSLYGLQNINMAHVSAVILSNNCITGSSLDPQFPTTPFAGMPDIYGIALHNNSIEALPATFLNGLSYLAELSLTNNQLTSLPTNFFAGQNLLRLTLNNNKFSSLTSIDISGMSNLQVINLSGNTLGSISGSYFQNNSSLTAIYLSNTGLLIWPSHLLDNLSGLQTLDLSNNSLLTFLPSNIASGSYIYLTGNIIPALTQSVILITYPNVNFIF